MLEDGRWQVTATVGPWTGTVITLPQVEAEQAIADQWAVARTEAPFDLAIPPNEYPELTAQERNDAEAAAQAWVDAQHQAMTARLN